MWNVVRGSYEVPEVKTRRIIGIFTEKGTIVLISKYSTVLIGLNNLLYCILKVLVETFQNYSSLDPPCSAEHPILINLQNLVNFDLTEAHNRPLSRKIDFSRGPID